MLIEGKKAHYRIFIEKPLKVKGKFGSLFFASEQGAEKPLIVRRVRIEDIDSQALVRYKREISASISLSGFSATVDFGRDDEYLFIFRQYVPGKSLNQMPSLPVWLGRKKTVKAVVSFFIRAAEKLHELHLAGFLHNDIRLSNIIAIPESFTVPVNSWSQDLSPGFIDLGLLTGIPPATDGTRLPYSINYSSPELLLEQYAIMGPTSDVYSLALCLYEVLVGSAPFTAEHPELSFQKQLNLPLPEDGDLTKELLMVLQKATCKHRFALPPPRYEANQVTEFLQQAIKKRYPSALEFAQALRGIL